MDKSQCSEILVKTNEGRGTPLIQPTKRDSRESLAFALKYFLETNLLLKGQCRSWWHTSVDNDKLKRLEKSILQKPSPLLW